MTSGTCLMTLLISWMLCWIKNCPGFGRLRFFVLAQEGRDLRIEAWVLLPYISDGGKRKTLEHKSGNLHLQRPHRHFWTSLMTNVSLSVICSCLFISHFLINQHIYVFVFFILSCHLLLFLGLNHGLD